MSDRKAYSYKEFQDKSEGFVKAVAAVDSQAGVIKLHHGITKVYVDFLPTSIPEAVEAEALMNVMDHKASEAVERVKAAQAARNVTEDLS